MKKCLVLLVLCLGGSFSASALEVSYALENVRCTSNNQGCDFGLEYVLGSNPVYDGTLTISFDSTEYANDNAYVELAVGERFLNTFYWGVQGPNYIYSNCVIETSLGCDGIDTIQLLDVNGSVIESNYGESSFDVFDSNYTLGMNPDSGFAPLPNTPIADDFRTELYVGDNSSLNDSGRLKIYGFKITCQTLQPDLTIVTQCLETDFFLNRPEIYSLRITTLEGNDVNNDSISFGVGPTVVPIPAAAWLFGSGLMALGWARRRSQSLH